MARDELFSREPNTYDIWIHHTGRNPVCIDTVKGTKPTAKQAAKAASSVWYPHHTTKWNGDTALLVKDEAGTVVATVSIDSPDQPYAKGKRALPSSTPKIGDAA